MSLFPVHILDLADQILTAAQNKHLRIATAESCTGGMIATLLTEIPGSSATIERGFVTYSNAAKEELLGVDPVILANHGAVSKQTAAAMAEGACNAAPVDFAVAVTGIAGPGGGTVEKPVGLVYIATASAEGTTRVVKNIFKGDRAAVRLQTAEHALRMLLEDISAA